MKSVCSLILSTTLALFSFGTVSSQKWGDFGKKEQQGVSFDIPLKLEVVGDAKDSAVVLEGTTRIKDRKLDQYFKKQKLEFQSYGTTERNVYQKLQDENSGNTGDFDSFEDSGSISILKAGFKLLRVTPIVGTSDVTVEVFFGEDPFTPHLEVLNASLNPFKKTQMEVVQSWVNEIDFRNVKVVVTLNASLREEMKQEHFTAQFDCTLTLGDSHLQPDYYPLDETNDSLNQGQSAQF